MPESRKSAFNPRDGAGYLLSLPHQVIKHEAGYQWALKTRTI